MKTAAYTILKNEAKYIETWLHYTKDFDYRVLLDTGSTDGSWEMLKDAAQSDSNLIIEQKTFEPWIFCDARNYNLSMIPEDVDWCLSPDMDEYFSINVIDEMNRMLADHPEVHNMSTTRLDIYAREVFIGPPKHLASNKIHRRHDYKWVQPIYEHLRWIHDGVQEIELHLSNVYLVHNQDFKKKERSELYLKMLTEEWQKNPSNCWTLWFLVNHYYKEQDLEMFIRTGCDFVRYHTQFDNKYREVLYNLKMINQHMNINDDLRSLINTVL